MNKLLLILFLISFTLFAQTDNKVDTVFYNWYMEKPNAPSNGDLEVERGFFLEGGGLVIPSTSLDNVDSSLDTFQTMWNAFAGATLQIEENALNHNVRLHLYIRGLDETTGLFKIRNGVLDTLFFYFEVRVENLETNEIIPVDSSFYFNEGTHAVFKLYKNQNFFKYLQKIGIESTTPLAYGFLINEKWVFDGIETTNNQNFIGFRASHFSKFGGGRGILVPVERDKPDFPENFKLNQNYPNPFNPETVISFELPAQSDVIIKVYDINGKIVDNLILGTLSSGQHSLKYSAGNLASGVYFYKLTANSLEVVKKMMIIK